MTQQDLQNEVTRERQAQRQFETINYSHKIYDLEAEMGVSDQSHRAVASGSFNYGRGC